MEKVYDRDAIRATLAGAGVEAVIQPSANRAEAIACDGDKCRPREKVERFFNKITQFRRIARRYDKLAKTFLAFIHVVSTWITFRL